MYCGLVLTFSMYSGAVQPLFYDNYLNLEDHKANLEYGRKYNNVFYNAALNKAKEKAIDKTETTQRLILPFQQYASFDCFMYYCFTTFGFAD